MPEFARLRAGCALAVLLAALALSGPTGAAPGGERAALGASLIALNHAATDPGQRDSTARMLVEGAGLGDLVRVTLPTGPAAAAPPAGRAPVEAAALDLRLALTMLIQSAGATDTGAVILAQSSPNRRSLVIQKGDATLADLATLLREHQMHDIAPSGALVVRMPLVIWDGASLSIGPGEVVEFSRADGAFLLNFGQLALHGATLRSTPEANPRLPRFAPFITTAGSGTVQVSGSRIEGLGFGKTLAFSGFSILRNSLFMVRKSSFLKDTLFRSTVSVSISAARDIRVEGNRFQDARGPALILSNSARAQILSNLFAGRSGFNAIQVLDGSVDAVISGNVVLGGAKTGIVVRKKSHRPHVTDNIVWHRDGGGITIDLSDCASVLSNTVLDNALKGIEIRSSGGSLVQGNLVMENASAGIWISAQRKTARTFVTGNVLHANRAGLATATGAFVVLRGNDFSGQFPRFLAGDIATQSRHVAGDLGGATPVMLSAAGASDVPADAATCGAIGGRT